VKIYELVLMLFSLAYTAEIVFFIMGLYRSARAASPEALRELPTVCVILPVRNEEKMLPQTLESLYRQDYPAQKWQLILVDDHSTDRTAEVAVQFQQKMANLIILPAQANTEQIGPKKKAILTAMAHTNTEVILTTDADVRHNPAWIRTMVQHLGQENAAVVGSVDRRGENNWLHELLHLQTFSTNIIACGGLGWGIGISSFGANFGYRRTAFEQVGGFGNTAYGISGDDDLLLQRMTGAGLRAVFVMDPRARVITWTDATPGDTWAQGRRHLSASRRYRWPLQIAGAAWFLYSALIVVGTVVGLLSGSRWLLTAALAAWFWKGLMEIVILRNGARLLDEKLAWKTMLAAVLIHPWWFTVILPFAFIGKLTWKGRVLKERRK